MPLLIKRLLEVGAERLGDGPDALRQLLAELRLPKDALSLLLAQLDETKNGLYKVVAKEVREFLDSSNLSEELTKALTRLSFEIRTEIRFIPNDRGGSTTNPGKAPSPEGTGGAAEDCLPTHPTVTQTSSEDGPDRTRCRVENAPKRPTKEDSE